MAGKEELTRDVNLFSCLFVETTASHSWLSTTVARRFAICSFWCPFAAALVTFVPLTALAALPTSSARWLGLTAVGLGCLMALLGIALACLALVEISPGQRRTVLGRASFGIFGNGILFAFDFWGMLVFARDVEGKPALAAPTALEAKLASSRALTNLSRLQRRFELAAENQHGEGATVAEVSARLVERIRKRVEDLNGASEPLRGKRLLNMAGVETQDELARKKELLRRLILAYDEWEKSPTNFFEEYERELTAKSVFTAAVRRSLRNAQPKIDIVNGYSKNVMRASTQWAEAELKALELLDANWENWSYNEDTRKVEFQDSALLAEYNQDVQAANEARKRAEDFRQKLLVYLQK
jgi:hypothetical protein